MSLTRTEAEACAASLPTGIFVLDDITVAVSVIELAMDLWKACAPTVSANVFVSSQIQDDGTYAKPLFRRARRRVRQAARQKGQDLSSDQLDTLTNQMLTYVATRDSSVAVACCAELPEEPVSFNESDDDD